MKNLLRYILLCIGVLLGNNAVQAKDYVKEIILNNPPYIVEWENVYSWTSSDLNYGDTRIGLKNGGTLFLKVQDPEFEYTDGGCVGGFWVEEEKAFKVEKAGFIHLYYHIPQGMIWMSGDVNYFGVLQYQGSDAPEEIIVTKENEHELIGVPDGVFELVGWFCLNISEEIDEDHIISLNSSMTLADLLAYGTDFYVYFDDGTSNRYTDSDGQTQGYGTSYATIHLVDHRNLPSQTYTISATTSSSEGGTISGQGTYNSGESVTLTATPSTGYTFINWTEDGTIVSTDPVYTFTVTSDRSLVANFEKLKYQLVFDSNGNGQVSARNYETNESYTSGILLPYGTVIEFHATPDEGATFSGWYLDGEFYGDEASISVSVSSDVKMLAKFSETATGISTTEAGGREAGLFNLSGQRVGSGYKGIVIRNGKKIIKR